MVIRIIFAERTAIVQQSELAFARDGVWEESLPGHPKWGYKTCRDRDKPCHR